MENLMHAITNPRSVLHALEPIGRGTSDVESLVSYFCRLAVSHSTSTQALSRAVIERIENDFSPHFGWHQRQISGLRESALTWSSALSALTTVPRLDGLTFLPWRDVIAQNGLAVGSTGQFCAHCFAEDRAAGRTPYFRLAWEAEQVSVCQHHKVPLTCHCPSCGNDNVRHTAAFVIPGWCTKCGAFLGKEPADKTHEERLEPSALWKARQIGQLVALQDKLAAQPTHDGLVAALLHIIAEMDGGQSAVFARRIGVGKSTVHHWLKTSGTPKLDVSLDIAAQSGLSLLQLLTGDTDAWHPPEPAQQLTLQLQMQPRPARAVARQLDWVDIEQKLQAFLAQPNPLPVLEVAQRLGVEARQLYLRANRTTRQIGARWSLYIHRRQAEKVQAAWPHLEAACRQLLQEGRAVTRREIAKRVPMEVLSTVPRLFDVLKEVQRSIAQVRP
jgi:DNA-binding phage protein